MKIELKNALKDCELFADLNDESLADLQDIVKLRMFQPGEVLFWRGKKADGFYLITDGEVEVFCSGENGREQILHTFSDGELCGEVPLFEGGVYPASARARGELITLYIPGSDFLDIAYENPQILLEMLAVLSRRLKKFVNLVESLSLKDVTTRLMNYLRNRSDDAGKVVLDCSKAELAARIGTVPETISRSFRKLRTVGFILAQTDDEILLDREIDELILSK